jgi:hypothetical protein
VSLSGMMPLVALIAAGFAVLVVAKWPRFAVLAALALGMLQYAPTKAYPVLPGAFTAVDDLLLLMLGLRWAAGVAAGRTRPPMWVLALLGIWMGAGIVNVVVRDISLMTAAASYRLLFMPALLFLLCADHARRPGFARSVINVIVAVALLNAAVAIVQAVLIGSIRLGASGLMAYGGANALGFIILLAIVLVASRGGSTAQTAWLVILGLFGMIAAQSRAAIITAPVALVLPYRRRLGRPAVVLSVVVVVVAAAVVLSVALSRSNMTVSRDLWPGRLIAAQMQSPDRGGGRLLPLFQLPTMFAASPLSWIGGLGPGQYGSAFHQIPWLLHYTYQVANSEWTVIWGEYGILGLLCLGAILGRVLVICRRARDVDGPAWVAQVVRAAPSVVLVALMGMTVLAILEYQPFSYPFWAVLGLIEAAYLGRLAQGSRSGAQDMAEEPVETPGGEPVRTAAAT